MLSYLDSIFLDEIKRSFPEVERKQQEEDWQCHVDPDARVIVHVSAEYVAEQQTETGKQKEECAQSATNPERNHRKVRSVIKFVMANLFNSHVFCYLRHEKWDANVKRARRQTSKQSGSENHPRLCGKSYQQIRDDLRKGRCSQSPFPPDFVTNESVAAGSEQTAHAVHRINQTRL